MDLPAYLSVIAGEAIRAISYGFVLRAGQVEPHCSCAPVLTCADPIVFPSCHCEGQTQVLHREAVCSKLPCLIISVLLICNLVQAVCWFLRPRSASPQAVEPRAETGSLEEEAARQLALVRRRQ